MKNNSSVKIRILLLLIAIFSAQAPQSALNRHIHVVGSSTAYPIITVAAEHFGSNSPFNTPVVESTGTGGGIKLFCSGIGLSTPDIVMTSRRMKQSERIHCEKNHVNDIREIKIGFDGIVIASSSDGPHYELSHRDIYLALARWVPMNDSPDSFKPNPYKIWKEINPALPDQEIRVYGPPPTSGTRDILLERVFTSACNNTPNLQDLFSKDRARFYEKCHSLREDGVFINAGENDSRVVRKLFNDPQALGILGFNFLDRNSKRLQAAKVKGSIPDFESIESGSYALSRPLYLYIKSANQRMVPGLEEFVSSIISKDSIGVEGRLFDQGLIPLPNPKSGNKDIKEKESEN